MPPMVVPGRRQMARCEVHCLKAESAARRMLPYLLVKREQALLLLQVREIRARTSRRFRERFESLEALRRTLLSMHEGRSQSLDSPPLSRDSLRGYSGLGPTELGWTRDQVHAYLAGIMDSDGSFRIETRQVRRMLHPHYRINIRCAQVAPSPAVELLARTFGGNVGIRQDYRSNHRALATWSLHDRAAVPAIEALLPYLVVKQTEAWLLLQLRGLKANGKEGTTEWVHANRWHERVNMTKRCYSSDEVATFERICQMLQSIHSSPQPEDLPVLTVTGESRPRRPSDPAAPSSAACPTSACNSPSRSRSLRGDRSG